MTIRSPTWLPNCDRLPDATELFNPFQGPERLTASPRSGQFAPMSPPLRLDGFYPASFGSVGFFLGRTVYRCRARQS